MTQEQALAIAHAMGGTATHTGGNVFCVLFDTPEGELVVISDDDVLLYSSRHAWENDEEHPIRVIQYRF